MRSREAAPERRTRSGATVFRWIDRLHSRCGYTRREVAEDDLRIVEELWAGLDSQPYHVFLGVTEETAGDELRAAFHERAARFHPDRWYTGVDEATRSKVWKKIRETIRQREALRDHTKVNP